MITSYNVTNTSEYRALFDEATDILSGFKRVRTFDLKEGPYYYKHPHPEALEADGVDTVEDLLELLYPALANQPTDVISFASALDAHKVLYVKHGTVTPGFNPMGGITTLEEYFSWIAELGSINRKYTVLPLDKECFEINANARSISIPADYKKNGIAVQGDDLAEIVYFKVDRYFDYMDLNTADIYIQWETPKGADGQTIKSVSTEYIRDIESEPGKLIFGWAISNKITGTPGTLKFSVRFFKWKDKAENLEPGAKRELDYSFSTLTAQIPIQAGLNFDLATHKETNNIDDCGQRVIERLEDSVIAGGYAAALPNFNVDLDSVYELDSNGERVLSVLASPPDTGMISYHWKKIGLNPNNNIDEQDIHALESYFIYVPIEDSIETLRSKVENDEVTRTNYPHALYMKNGSDSSGQPVYTLYPTLPPVPADLAHNDFMLYERQSAIKVKHTGAATEEGASGVYYAVARNRITNSVSERDSTYAYFYRPADIAFEEVNGHPKSHVQLTDIDNNKDGVISVDVVDVKDAQGNVVENYTYQWYRVEDWHNVNAPDVPMWYNEETGFAIDGSMLNSVSGTSKISGANKVSGATSATYTVPEDKPGYYLCEVTATRNGAKKVRCSNWSRVTEFAKVPEISKKPDASLNYYIENFENDPPTILINTKNVNSDYYHIQWFGIDIDPTSGKVLSMPIGDPHQVDPSSLKDGYLEAKLTLEMLERASLSAKPGQGLYGGDFTGTYYAKVTNYLNESSRTTAEITDPQDPMLFVVIE